MVGAHPATVSGNQMYFETTLSDSERCLTHSPGTRQAVKEVNTCLAAEYGVKRIRIPHIAQNIGESIVYV